MGVSSGGWPRERCMRRGCTLASSRWVAEACRRGGRATPILVIPARPVARRAPALVETEDGGKTVGGVHAQERESRAVALEDVLREEADAAGADAHGGRGEAVDVLPVQAIVLGFWCSDAVRRCVVELRQQPDCT